MSKKYDIANFISIGAAELLYKKGVSSSVTDGQYVQIEKEEEVVK